MEREGLRSLPFAMHIYMRHPQHGTKVAIAEAEAVYDESKGWTRYDPHEPRKAVAVAEPVKAEPVVKRKYTRRTIQ